MTDLTVEVYDTTLRDGAQQEGMNLSVADKMAIAPLLDELGAGIIEGGWPGAVPKDTEFFALVKKELTFVNAQFAAFGMTRRAGSTAAADPQVGPLDLRYEKFALPQAGQMLITYHAGPGSESEQRLHLLAALAT